jgi:hypothetical protein
MEIFKKIGLTSEEVRKISPEMEEAVIQLEGLAPFIESGKAPTNIKSVYDSIFNEIERTLFSKDFKEAASKSGVKTIGVVDVDAKVEVVDVPKVKTFQEIIAERKNKIAGKTEIEEPKIEEPKIEEPKTEEPISDNPTFQEIIERRKKEKSQSTSEEPKNAPIVIPTKPIEDSELKGFIIKGDKSGAYSAQDRITMLLAYGGYDGIMSMYEGSNGYNFLMSLPKSLGFVVWTLPLSSEDAQFYTDGQDIWRSYLDNPKAEIAVLSRDKKELEELATIVASTSSTKIQGNILAANISKDYYNEAYFEVVNDSYSRDIVGEITYEIMKAIKLQWKGEDIGGYNDSLGYNDKLPYGVRLTDHIYSTPEMYYSKGGSTIVVKNRTFYVPKGIKKAELFCEVGIALKDNNIKTRNFDKNIGLTHDFQNKTSSFEKAETCRVLGSTNEDVLIVNSVGNAFYLSSSTYNYFKKYYGVNIQLKSAGEVAVVYSDGSVVGLISIRKSYATRVISLFDIKQIHSELRSIDAAAYDFMISKAEAAAEETEIEIEKIEEGEDDIEQMKAEFKERISFLEDMAEMSKEANEPQELIDELNAEIESLKMIQSTIL